ncbi:MAG: Crp/Fnr family transcriptional regulator [Chitinophaga sp.]|uniref:Crp/Fnr family transcriptional regulator n=1 Tax=Chitinophaga sp. TaxID=1869181 RepID=UPI0025BA01FB|nr:Crp/Fnr family transcriptional regulator [Chitinophaga sp.]MBV8251350.1 Crp/Fnr family transcriptional regulator [Chitinophaga sp.]
MDQASIALTSFINKYCKVSGEELQAVIQAFTFSAVNAQSVILRSGQTCNLFSINLQGAFRSYTVDKGGNETTTWLIFEQMPVIEPTSFLLQRRSDYTIQALEDSLLASITYDALQQLYDKIPAFQVFGRKLMEQLLLLSMCRVDFLLLETPQERYERLLKSTNFMQRVPLKYLASYIDVTPSTLSRLRRKVKS